MDFTRTRRKNKHHLIPKSRLRKGQHIENNIIHLDERRHSAFHLLFSNRTLIEAARVLVRTHNIFNGTDFHIERSER